MKQTKERSLNQGAGALPKLCGSDIELSNFIDGTSQIGGTGWEAAQALLREIRGLPAQHESASFDAKWPAAAGYSRTGDGVGASTYSSSGGWDFNPQDVGRRFLPSSGFSAYIDLNHLEVCAGEVFSAFDQCAARKAMLSVAQIALERANAKRFENRRIKLLVNNSDGLGHSWGSHLSVLIQRQSFDNILWRKPLHLQFLASFQVSNILLSGQGKVGTENSRPAAPYQLSQRADFFECLLGTQTTQNRPIVNSRDESLTGRRVFGDSSEPARLHIIFYDSHLADGSCVLTVGSTQMILTMLELGLANPQLVLDDPLEAVVSYSHDPTLKTHAELITKKRLTILELQSAYLEEVKRHAARGVFGGIVPRYEEIIALWEDTLNKFAAGDLMALAPRLDWVMKLMAIDRAMELNPSLDWDSPEVKMLDAMYSSLGGDGLFQNYEASGFAERLIPAERVEYFTENPPEDTRAWTRAMVLRRALSEGIEVESVDWDRMTFRMRGRYPWPTYRTLELANPFGFTRAEAEPIFDSCEEFADLLDGLEALASDAGSELLAYTPAINQ